MQLLPVLLSTVITLAVGYGGGNYGPDGGGYYGYEDYKNECRKLKHYDIEPTNIAHFNREAKFSHVEKHGKEYIMISCPVDSQEYALIAEQEGTTSKISTSDYSDTVILADGSHVSVLAKCDGKRIVAKNADGDEVKIKKVACIQYPEAVPWSCSSCNTNSITLTKGNDIENMGFESTVSHNPCTRQAVVCTKKTGSSCQNIELETIDINAQSEKFLYPHQVIAFAFVYITCNNDGLYLLDDTDLKGIKEIKCAATDCD